MLDVHVYLPLDLTVLFLVTGHLGDKSLLEWSHYSFKLRRYVLGITEGKGVKLHTSQGGPHGRSLSRFL